MLLNYSFFVILLWASYFPHLLISFLPFLVCCCCSSTSYIIFFQTLSFSTSFTQQFIAAGHYKSKLGRSYGIHLSLLLWCSFSFHRQCFLFFFSTSSKQIPSIVDTDIFNIPGSKGITFFCSFSRACVNDY